MSEINEGAAAVREYVNHMKPETPAAIAAEMVDMIKASFPDQPDWRFATGVAEEAGEFVGAFNRYSNTSRRTGTLEEVAKELADVVITAFMAAHVLGFDLDTMVQRKAHIMRLRGWEDPPMSYYMDPDAFSPSEPDEPAPVDKHGLRWTVVPETPWSGIVYTAFRCPWDGAAMFVFTHAVYHGLGGAPDPCHEFECAVCSFTDELS